MAIVYNDNNGLVLRKLEKLEVSDDEEDGIHSRRRKTNHGVQYSWTKVELDENETPEEHMGKENFWIKDNVSKIKVKGRDNIQVRYMVCKGAPSRKCKAKYKVILRNGVSVELFRNGEEHLPHYQQRRVYGLSNPDVRKRLDELFLQGFRKPNHIYEEIKKEFPDFEFHNKQLTNMLYHMGKRYKGVNNICFNTIKEWAEDNAEVPEDENKPFVIAYKGKISPRNSKKAFFQSAISTQRLIKLARKWCKYLNADSSEYIDIKGLPFSAIGFTDANGDFHPVMAFMTKLETEDDWKFAFDALIQAIEAYGCEENYEEDEENVFETPSLISNIDPLIQKGFEASFGEMKKCLPYWTSFRHKIQNYPSILNDKELKSQILEEVHALWYLPTKEMFQRGISLFLEKYEGHDNPEMPKFLSKFKKSFVFQNNEWFEASDLEAVRPNSPIEKLILDLKSKYKWSPNQPLNEILADILEIVEDWSVDRDPARTNANDLKKVHNEKMVNRKLHKIGWEWLKTNHRNENEMLEDGKGQFFFRSDSEASSKDLKSLIEEWNNVHRTAIKLDKLLKVSQTLHVVKYCDSENKFGICSCPKGMKKKICKHSIGIAIQQKKLEKPKQHLPALKREKRPQKVNSGSEESSDSEEEEVNHNIRPSRVNAKVKEEHISPVRVSAKKVKEETDDHNDLPWDLIDPDNFRLQRNESNSPNDSDMGNFRKLEALPECFVDENDQEFESNPRRLKKSRISKPEEKRKEPQKRSEQSEKKRSRDDQSFTQIASPQPEYEASEPNENSTARKRSEEENKRRKIQGESEAEINSRVVEEILQRPDTDPDKIVLRSILQRNRTNSVGNSKRSKLESVDSTFLWY